jgi:hypothetical protein
VFTASWAWENARVKLDKGFESRRLDVTHTYEMKDPPKVWTEFNWIDTHSNLGLEKTSTQSQHKMQCRLALDIVVCQCTLILELLTRKDEPLLVGWDAFAILNLCFNICDSVT